MTVEIHARNDCFSLTRETSHAKLGPIDLSAKDTRTVNIPVRAGAGALVVDVRLLAFSSRKS